MNASSSGIICKSAPQSDIPASSTLYSEGLILSKANPRAISTLNYKVETRMLLLPGLNVNLLLVLIQTSSLPYTEALTPSSVNPTMLSALNYKIITRKLFFSWFKCKSAPHSLLNFFRTLH